MGHERIGHLPSTKKWRNIVADISLFSVENNNVASLATQTTKNVAHRFAVINQDSGVLASFTYLLVLLQASKQKNPSATLKKYGITLSSQFSVLELARSIKQFNSGYEENKEYGTFATQSLIDTVGIWLKQNSQQTSLLFGDSVDSFEPWRKAANAGGFSEISRIYFASFISRYLRYFLEREASASIQSIEGREIFGRRINEHVNEISFNAFETSKVTQSLGAGWYNNHAAKSFPSHEEIKGYVAYALKKLSNNILFRNELGE